MVQLAWKTSVPKLVLRIPQVTKQKSVYNLAIPLLVLFPKESKAAQCEWYKTSFPKVEKTQ